MGLARRLRSLELRVMAVVLLAALAAASIAIWVATRAMTDLAEVGLVEETVESADRTRTAIRTRVDLARAQLETALMLVETGRAAETASLLAPFVRAARIERADESIEIVRDERVRQMLGTLATTSTSTAAVDGVLTVTVTRADTTAIAIVEIASLLPSGPGRHAQIALSRDPRLEVAGVIVERRTSGHDELAVAKAALGDGRVLRLEASLAGARAVVDATFRRVIGWTTIVTLAAALVIAWTLSRRVTRPVRKLARAVRAGHDELVLPRLHDDEIGELGAAIQTMHQALAHDARLLRASAELATEVVAVREPRLVLEHLQRALDTAHERACPRVHDAQAAAPLLVTLGLAPDAFVEDDAAARRLATVRERDGWTVVRLLPADAEGPVVVCHGPLTEGDRRSIEVMCSTAAAAIQSLALARVASIHDKLALTGRLAASVAHELNNPLAYVMLNLGVLEEQLAGADRDLVRETLEGVQRVTHIVQDLSRLTRGGTHGASREDLCAIAADQLKVARARVGHGIELVLEPSPPRWVTCNRGRIGQALLNLIINAVDAVALVRPDHRANGGRIVVSLREAAGSCVVAVRDDGPGIGPEIRRHLFDAFTTSKADRGTGLGLYLSRQFVREDGGNLVLVETGPRGTCFELSLPAVPAEVIADVVPETAPAPRPHVLVIDDEPQIVSTMRRVLSRFADVEATTDPRAGLERARTGSHALILCDWNMPGLSGADLHATLMREAPDIAARIVIMTGGFDIRVPPGTRVLYKPIEAATIRELVHAA